MATYDELYQLHVDYSLIGKVSTAIAIAAEAIRIEDPATINHDLRLKWALLALNNVSGMAHKMMWILLAQNASFTIEQIQNASDVNIQNAVNSAVEIFYQ